MSSRSRIRGHAIEEKDGDWIYSDTHESVIKNKDRACNYCSNLPTQEGHDRCLDFLSESSVLNACCGHGKRDEAYIQFQNGDFVYGENAFRHFEAMKEGR